jgi:mitochondrial fission protein ELM1
VTPAPPVWLITNGAAGSDVQARGVAEALGAPYRLEHVNPGPPWRWLAPWGPVAPGEVSADERSNARFGPPWPGLLISVGRQATPYARAIRRASGGQTFTVALQDPKTGAGSFDFIWAPEHDPVDGDNVIKTLTSPHHLTAAAMAEAAAVAREGLADLPRPWVLLLVGGPNGLYRFDPETTERLLTQAAQAIGSGSLLITTSRRTAPEVTARLRAWAPGRPSRLYDGEGPNPYQGWLALADAVIVTADSVNMAGEAAFTGKPVHVFHPPGGEGSKFARYHAALEETGATRPFDGVLQRWTYAPVDATTYIADALRTRLLARGVTLD